MHYGGDMVRTPTAYLAWAVRCQVTKSTAVPASGLMFDLGESVVIVDRRFIVVLCTHVVGDVDTVWKNRFGHCSADFAWQDSASGEKTAPHLVHLLNHGQKLATASLRIEENTVT